VGGFGQDSQPAGSNPYDDFKESQSNRCDDGTQRSLRFSFSAVAVDLSILLSPLSAVDISPLI
jgi:hypothetical protein